MQTIELDRLDLGILDHLQRDAHASNATVAGSVHLSPSQVSRRVQRLEACGLIGSYVALLDPAAAGLDVTAYVSVSLERHGEGSSEAFHEQLRGMAEVLECFAVTGEADYLLRIVAPNLAALSEFMLHRLLRVPGVRSVKSSIVLQAIKRTTVLPLAHLVVGR
jgi:Lrp/AsnC family leucine-responsive transcriptional regulator